MDENVNWRLILRFARFTLGYFFFFFFFSISSRLKRRDVLHGSMSVPVNQWDAKNEATPEAPRLMNLRANPAISCARVAQG